MFILFENKNIERLHIFIYTMIYRIFLFAASLLPVILSQQTCAYNIVKNNCITFSVSSGTGCAWMCNYCATQLGTNNYYFTDGVCTYQQGTGCVGNPVAGNIYTCCSV
jgi:hypothetical protein